MISFISNEDESKQLIFLDITISNNCKGQRKVYHKEVIQIKPNSYIDQGRIWLENYLHDEMNFLIDMFVGNGNGCNHMLAIINEKGHHRNETNNESNTKNTVKLLSTTVIGLKLRKDLNKIRFKVVFPLPANQKSILRNKSKLLSNISLICIN